MKVKLYQVKSTAMDSLTTSKPTGGPSATVPWTASFFGKATIQDVTDELNPTPVDGNATFKVMLTDRGEPGSQDSWAITVNLKTGALFFSSKWNGTTTVEQILGGGNLQIHP